MIPSNFFVYKAFFVYIFPPLIVYTNFFQGKTNKNEDTKRNWKQWWKSCCSIAEYVHRTKTAKPFYFTIKPLHNSYIACPNEIQFATIDTKRTSHKTCIQSSKISLKIVKKRRWCTNFNGRKRKAFSEWPLHREKGERKMPTNFFSIEFTWKCAECVEKHIEI